MSPQPLRIANCSGFYGDRLSAAREMVDGGPIDVLTGDWLAELTMLILARGRQQRPDAGYAMTFLTQMEQVLATCLERGIKVVSNAGGLNPAGCAAALGALADRLGLAPRIAYVEGDDLLHRLAELEAAGCDLRHLDTGELLAERGARPLTANAYLGGWGIAEALRNGADIVVCGRVSDASLAVGPAAWRFGWRRDDWDQLAGAVVAGHLIECGAQVTGGNYAFFGEVPGLERCGFPLAEVFEDGSCVVTKHPDTGGLVDVGTVTAQLVYEIGAPHYPNPDVTAHFDSIRLTPDGADRIRVDRVTGEPPPATTKVGLNFQDGFRNQMTLVLTGANAAAKAAAAEQALWAAVPGGQQTFSETRVELIGTPCPDPKTEADAVSFLRVAVADSDEAKVGRAFTAAVVELALASYPGFSATSPPGKPTPRGVFWPALIPADLIRQQVVFEGQSFQIASPPTATADRSSDRAADAQPPTPPDAGPTRPAPLGDIAGARSGDKAGNANVGVWARSDDAFHWLDTFLTAEQFRALVPEAAALDVERHRLPNLRALNFVVRGLLGDGVASSLRLDPQAKGLGEYLRGKVVDVPVELLP